MLIYSGRLPRPNSALLSNETRTIRLKNAERLSRPVFVFFTRFPTRRKDVRNDRPRLDPFPAAVVRLITYGPCNRRHDGASIIIDVFARRFEPDGENTSAVNRTPATSFIPTARVGIVIGACSPDG